MVVDLANETFFKSRLAKDDLEKLDSLLSTFKVKINSLKITIEEEQLKVQHKKAILEFDVALKEIGLVDVFEKGNWTDNYPAAKTDTTTKINLLQEEISELKSLSLFADVNNKESLAKWGIEYFKRPLTLEEESILVYFQRFPAKANDFYNRYLFSPEELFGNLDYKEKTDTGFWLNMDGVYEFIKYTSNPVLHTEANQQKLKELQQLSGSFEEQIEKNHRN